MARIRHIALVVDDSEKTAAFYTSAFGLKEVFRQKNDDTRGQWAIYLTDGYINLALLPVERPDRPLGVDHFGFAVDDIDEGLKTAVAAGAIPPSRTLPRDGRQAETFVRDPHLNIKLDISRGWLTEKPEGAAFIDTTTGVDILSGV
jgi:catechol 2,3-dioxygenase-like lactoylglutathione lyase family enzyme